jgi:ABC-2 type transport system permease protein
MKVIGALWKLNAAEELQYRANFVASFASTCFYLLTALLTLSLFFRHATTLGGWSFWEVVVLLGVFNALSGLVEALLRPGIGDLAAQVRSGNLDLVLSRPVDAQVFVTFRHIDIWRLTDIFLGLGVSAYALVHMGHFPTAWQITAFFLTFVAASLVVYAIWVTLMSLAFWFVSVENIATLFDAVFEGARYPVSAYPAALRFLFFYLLPVAWTTTIPASALTGRLNLPTALAAAGVGLGALVFSRVLWRAAIRRYTGASS